MINLLVFWFIAWFLVRLLAVMAVSAGLLAVVVGVIRWLS